MIIDDEFQTYIIIYNFRTFNTCRKALVLLDRQTDRQSSLIGFRRILSLLKLKGCDSQCSSVSAVIRLRAGGRGSIPGEG
jgi:hypothetical protein